MGEKEGTHVYFKHVNAHQHLFTQHERLNIEPFTGEGFYYQNPEERIRQQFMNDPLWGKG